MSNKALHLCPSRNQDRQLPVLEVEEVKEHDDMDLEDRWTVDCLQGVWGKFMPSGSAVK